MQRDHLPGDNNTILRFIGTGHNDLILHIVVVVVVVVVVGKNLLLKYRYYLCYIS
jgi:hypothetical protein